MVKKNKKLLCRIFQFNFEAIWVLTGQIGMVIGGFFGIKILTYILSSDEFGRLSLANTLVVLISINFFGPLSQGFMRYFAIASDNGELNSFTVYLNKYTRFSVQIVIFIVIVYLFACTCTNHFKWTSLIVVSLLTGAFVGWTDVRISVLSAARKRMSVAILNTATAFIKPVAAFFCSFLLIANADFVMIGNLLGLSIVACFIKIHFNKIAKQQPEPFFLSKKPNNNYNKIGKQVLSFSWPFFVWGMFGWIHQNCDKWALQTFYGTDVVGAFSVVTQLAVYPLIFISGFLSRFFLPIAYERAGNLYSDSAVKSANKILFIMAGMFIIFASVLVFLFFLFHNSLILLISNKQYVSYSYLLPWLTISWTFYYLGQTFTGFGLLMNKPYRYLFPILISGFIAAFSTFYLSSIIGLAGVILGLGISGFLYALWSMIIAFKLIIQ